MQPPHPIPHLPVLYYTVSHNVIESGNVTFINTTNHTILLHGVMSGHVYYVAVQAVNIIGSGMEASELITGQT